MNNLSNEERRTLAGLARIEIRRWSHGQNNQYMVDLMNIAINALEKPSGWISCNDQVPEPLDWVIAYDEAGTVKAYICPHTKEWVRDNGDELYQVTHWQPLPEPPNSKTNGDDCCESGMEQTNNGSAE